MKKIGTVAFSVALAAVASAPAQAQIVLKSRLSGLCVQPEGGYWHGNGSLVRQVACDPDDSSQQWELDIPIADRGKLWYRLFNRAHNYCLDLPDGNTNNGIPLQMWECNRSTTMRWTFAEDGRIKNFRTDRKCIDVREASLEVGALIQNYTCGGDVWFPDEDGGPVVHLNLAQIWDRP